MLFFCHVILDCWKCRSSTKCKENSSKGKEKAIKPMGFDWNWLWIS